MDCYSGGGEWSETYCTCISPIVIDVQGDGFDLTDGAGGVSFDMDGDGSPGMVSWTAAGSDDAWLVLDRDHNGTIDDGAELFGNITAQPPPRPGEEKNGFLALALWDRPDRGGDGDGAIDSRDAVFGSLRLWQDVNHDGVSGPDELHALSSLGVESISLDYRESRKKDRHGNRFRYRAKINGRGGSEPGKWAYDVFLLRGQ